MASILLPGGGLLAIRIRRRRRFVAGERFDVAVNTFGVTFVLVQCICCLLESISPDGVLPSLQANDNGVEGVALVEP